MTARDEIRDTVREHYAGAARRVIETRSATACCGPGAEPRDAVSRDLYDADELAGVPDDALRASLGCGNPTALAELRPGETVLDLGSGGGIDVLLSARRVGPGGRAYGLDMTDEMLELARANQRRAGIGNVEFLKGTIEEIPLPDATVDVVISNCVINLSSDKDRVLREVFRVLRPGGRFAVTDIVVRRDLPQAVRRSQELWAGCVAGALHERDYRAKLEQVGFHDIAVEPVRIYSREELVEAISGSCCGGGDDAAPEATAGTALAGTGIDLDEIDGSLMSAFIRASKR